MGFELVIRGGVGDDAGVSTVEVCETFLSLQGEGSDAGAACFFIRLSGCNLRCRYCDTVYAYEAGRSCQVAALAASAGASGAGVIEITGGEPLLQAGFRELAEALLKIDGRKVLVETNGTLDLSVVPEGVVAVVDVKCPGSGHEHVFLEENVARLRPYDEVKFVLSDRNDYEWAVDFVQKRQLQQRCAAIFFSPAWGLLDARELAEWMVKDLPPVRLQLALHKVLKIQ